MSPRMQHAELGVTHSNEHGSGGYCWKLRAAVSERGSRVPVYRDGGEKGLQATAPKPCLPQTVPFQICNLAQATQVGH